MGAIEQILGMSAEDLAKTPLKDQAKVWETIAKKLEATLPSIPAGEGRETCEQAIADARAAAAAFRALD